MDARPVIQVDLKVDGKWLSTVTLGAQSLHPFTHERLRKSEYPAGDAALMLHYAALIVAGYEVPRVFQDVIHVLYGEDVEWFKTQDEFPF